MQSRAHYAPQQDQALTVCSTPCTVSARIPPGPGGIGPVPPLLLPAGSALGREKLPAMLEPWEWAGGSLLAPLGPL